MTDLKIDLSKIKKLRKLKKISQENMAIKLGYKSPTGYSYLESGRCAITAEQLPIIANELGVSIEDLFLSYFPTKTVEKLAMMSLKNIA